MNIEEPLWVDGCPLCRIFSHEEIITKLYYPEKKEDVKTSEFVIVNCKTCKIPMIVYRDHVTTISKESWGRLLYICRKQFGSGTKIRNRPRTIKDHFHCHIINYVKRDK